MFQIKAFVSILASMINRLRATGSAITDFNVGGIARTLLEAVSQEIDELYQQMVASLQAAIATATYTSFGFVALPAVSANGVVRVTITAQTADVTIVAGTQIAVKSAPALIFVANQSCVITAGSTYVDVPVSALVAGYAGNVAAGTSFTVTATPVGFVSAISALGMQNGLDTESGPARYARFQAYISSLARSTLAGLTYGSLSVYLTDSLGNVTERVAAAVVYEPYTDDHAQSPSLFKIYIYNGVGAAPGASGFLVAATQSKIDGSYDALGKPVPGYKAAGTVAQVVAVTVASEAITAHLWLSTFANIITTTAAVEAAWTAYLAALPGNAPLVVAKLVAVAIDVAGVTDCTISLPAANVAGVIGTKYVAGAFTVTTTGGV